jgi:hypothetical protein
LQVYLMDQAVGDEGQDTMLKIFTLARLAAGGAILAVAAFGTLGALLGYETSTQTDVLAAILGGGATSVALVKLSVLA